MPNAAVCIKKGDVKWDIVTVCSTHIPLALADHFENANEIMNFCSSITSEINIDFDPKHKTAIRTERPSCIQRYLSLIKISQCEGARSKQNFVIHGGVLNCDGILSIKASRYWRKLHRLDAFENVYEYPDLKGNDTVFGLQKLPGVGGRSDRSIAFKAARPQIASRVRSTTDVVGTQVQPISTTISDRETSIGSGLSDVRAPPSPSQIVPACKRTVSHQTAQQSQRSSGVRFCSESKNSRRYRDARPSNFCHVCQRYQKRNTFAICTNIKYGLCRKVVCLECFQSNGWDWGSAMNNYQNWRCPHCADSCPLRAQCFTYRKTNKRRRLGIMKKRNFTRRKTT